MSNLTFGITAMICLIGVARFATSIIGLSRTFNDYSSSTGAKLGHNELEF